MIFLNIKEFKKQFIVLRNKGYVESLRKGPTGVGKTLESYMGLKENNLDLPDLGNIELKAHRDNSMNLITLFTFNRGAWLLNPLDAVRRYGTKDKNGRLGLYFTMSFQVNSAGLFLYCDTETVSVRHIDGTIIAKWKFSDL
ncbi:MAG: MvaI/BcnI family restriction endonuclease, partial [Athalassotoga sp.]|uniref:MvaI/BcnI family restriction endonuclease n=2 Tax=Athalassotoga sp. TaxID=2022597 RepID=UPI003D04C644